MNNEIEYLHFLSDVVKECPVDLDESKLLDLLQIKYRWPVDSVETINQFGMKSAEYFDHRGFLIYERWKFLYDSGYTSILCNVLDLTSDLRHIQDQLRFHRGSETNGNLYFTKGTDTHRPSFDPHIHDYNVIVKIVYGRSRWLLGNQELVVEKDDVLVIPKGTPHAVLDNPEPRLTLTLNVTG